MKGKRRLWGVGSASEKTRPSNIIGNCFRVHYCISSALLLTVLDLLRVFTVVISGIICIKNFWLHYKLPSQCLSCSHTFCVNVQYSHGRLIIWFNLLSPLTGLRTVHRAPRAAPAPLALLSHFSVFICDWKYGIHDWIWNVAKHYLTMCVNDLEGIIKPSVEAGSRWHCSFDAIVFFSLQGTNWSCVNVLRVILPLMKLPLILCFSGITLMKMPCSSDLLANRPVSWTHFHLVVGMPGKEEI